MSWCQGCIGVGRKCRYSGARRGIGGIKGYWRAPRGYREYQGAIRGIRGCQGVLGDGRVCRYSGARRVQVA